MWSIGIVVYEMLTGQLPFQGSSELEYLLSIFVMKGTPTEEQNVFFKSSPMLRLLSFRLPKIKGGDMSLEARLNEALPYGFARLFDLLTMVDPAKRPNCKQALGLLEKIRENVQIEMEGGVSYRRQDQPAITYKQLFQ